MLPSATPLTSPVDSWVSQGTGLWNGNESLAASQRLSAPSGGSEVFAAGHQFELIMGNLWFIVSRLRLLFYLVWPADTMFASLGEVPRYVAEVSYDSNCLSA